MSVDEKLKLAKQLIADREEIDKQLAALFGGEIVTTRKTKKCSKCGQEGHTAPTCTSEPRPTA
jgi:hypothetical protein